MEKEHLGLAGEECLKPYPAAQMPASVSCRCVVRRSSTAMEARSPCESTKGTNGKPWALRTVDWAKLNKTVAARQPSGSLNTHPTAENNRDDVGSPESRNFS